MKRYLTEKPTLETERLLLRPMSEKDVPDLSKWLGKDEVYTYWGRKASKAEKNPELLFYDPRPWVVRKPSADIEWGMVLKETGRVCGTISVFNVENNRMADVGYRLDPDCWRKGLATEALRQVIDFVFLHTELDRLNARADVRNIASCRVLEKSGFVREGTVRSGKMVSVYCDYNIYGMLRSDYEKK